MSDTQPMTRPNSPMIPKNVLQGIDDIANGRTASTDDLIAASKEGD